MDMDPFLSHTKHIYMWVCMQYNMGTEVHEEKNKSLS
jgi:hypothetical protein